LVEIEYVVALAMGITNLFKPKVPVAVVPFATIIIALALNIVNALIFGGEVTLAGKDALITSGIMAGLFAGGTATRKLIEGKNILER